MKAFRNKDIFRQKCFVDGRWIQADSKKSITVTNPADQKSLGSVPNCGALETRRAIASASKAWPLWRDMTAKARGDIMWRWAELIRANTEDLAVLMTLEQGKPLAESRAEIEYGNSFVEWFAEEGRRIYGDVIAPNKAGQHLIVIKQAIGVVGAITPWNFPIAMITRKIAPALAAGCTVVLKPAAETPFSALALAALAEKAGFPAGVINVLTGDAESIGGEMTSNSLVRKISFTGSTKIGKLLLSQAASTVKKSSMELGGNAPFIVFDDANLDAAVTGAIASKFRNTGQTCVCANRILVQDSVYDAFTKKLLAAVQKLKVGNGMQEDVKLGPLINAKAVEKVKAHVADAVQKGAKILLGGKPHKLGGWFYEPTILIDANASMLLAKEETFGPVAPLFRFKNEKEAIALSNNTEFGLAAYFYSENIHRVWRVSEALEYGIVGVNEGLISTEVAPFGGIKESGMGREGSKYGLEDYIEIKYLCMGSATKS